METTQLAHVLEYDLPIFFLKSRDHESRDLAGTLLASNRWSTIDGNADRYVNDQGYIRKKSIFLGRLGLVERR